MLNIGAFLFMISLSLISLYISNKDLMKEISCNELISKIEQNIVKKVLLYDDNIVVDTKEDKFYIITKGNFQLEKLIFDVCKEAKIEIKTGKENIVYKFFITHSNKIFTLLLCILLLSWFVSFPGKGDLLGGGEFEFELRVPNVTFDDIGGCTEAKKALTDIIKILKYNKKYPMNKKDLPKGILLYGPPGTGKTLLAKAMANSCNCPFLQVSASEFEEMFVGLGASRIRKLFAKAKASAPAIIFIDEIDTVNKRDDSFVHPSNKQTLNQLLKEMDGFDSFSDIIVIAATNNLEKLDEALLRSGRFDKKIKIINPDYQDRLDILKIYIKKIKHDDSIDLNILAKKMFGFSAADIANFFRQLTEISFKKNILAMEDFNKVFDVIASDVKTHNDMNINLNNIGGCKEAKKELKEIILFLNDKEKYLKIGASLPKGILLHGPPGTGKTMLARAVAGESKCEFIYANASEFENTFVGVGAENIRKLFIKARQYHKCIIFIDEIDALGSRNSKYYGKGNQTINQLLTELDGFKKDEDIFVFMATNNSNLLDKALLRSGRIDKNLLIDIPSKLEREEILHAIIEKNKFKLEENVDIHYIASITQSYTGADLFCLLNEAAIIAVNNGKEFISMKDIYISRDKIVMGSPNDSIRMKDKERKLTAYHEAGHALLAYYFCKELLTIHKATIIPYKGSLGHVSFFENEEKYSTTKEEYLNRIKMALGGMAAEEILSGSKNLISSGPSSDLQQATKIARLMVEKFGMGTLLMSIDRDKDNLSEYTAKILDNEANNLIVNCYDVTLEFLSKHTEEHKIIAEALLDRETLSLQDIDELLKDFKHN